MVERAPKPNKKDKYCDYSFEILKLGGANYRVPVLNNASQGKIIEKTASELPEENQSAANSRSNNNHSNQQRDQVNFTHFISIPIRDPIVR